MIQVQNLTKRYGSTLALAGLSLAVPDGAIFGLVGPNGSGKSTFLKLLMGLIFPDAGTIDLGGLPHTRIGYTPDRPFLPVRLRAAEFLSLAGALSGLQGQALRAAVETRLAQVSLSDAAKLGVGGLSKGMLQRLSVASALLHDPPLLLLDEPMSGLDPGQQAALREVIRSAHGEGRTILLSTHRLNEVMDLCTHVAILRQGRLVRAGALGDVLQPQHQLTITVEALPAEVADLIRARVPDAVIQENEIRISENGVSHKNELLRVLLDANCDIRQMLNERASLEEVYMEAVRP